MTLRCDVSPILGTRTPERGILWRADFTRHDGGHVTAQSRTSPATELFRAMRDAGVPDEDVDVWVEGREYPCLRYRSFWAAADWTLQESAGSPLRRVKWRGFEGI